MKILLKYKNMFFLMSMNKFWGIVYSMVDRSDVVLEVVDARFPSICRSTRLEEYVNSIEDCNLVIGLNKTDLIPKSLLDRWLGWFEERGYVATGFSASKRLGTSRIRRVLLRASKRKTAVVAVVGFPNTGKSSLINTLRGKAAAGVAPIPGKTRGEQKIRVSNSLFMFDTPGIIPAQLPEKHRILLGLDAITKIKDPEHAALILYAQAEELNPGAVAEHYGIENDAQDFLANLAYARNKIVKGNMPDERAAAIIFLSDHIRGLLQIYENPARPLRMSR